MERWSTPAAQAEVDRTTAHRWLKDAYPFQAAPNRGRRDPQEAIQARLLVLAEKPANTAEKAIGRGDDMTAIALPKGLADLFGEAG
jgi:hypothetical protein